MGLLACTEYFDFNHPEIVDFSARVVKPDMSQKEKAIALYYAVRDGIRYNPYVYDVIPESFSASQCLLAGQSYCIPKAVLLGALCRLNGIASRIGLADVRNHLSSPALIEWLRSDVFVMHGYVELKLGGKWVKATPAFDQTLCVRMGVAPLEFDGENDSIFHEFNGDGHKHMEYLKDHGQFDDVPFELITTSVAQAYPHLANGHIPDSKRQLLEE